MTTSTLLSRRRELSDFEPWIEFDGSKPLHRYLQQIGAEAGPGPELQDIRSEVGAGEHPRHSLPDGFSPPGRTA